MMQEITASNEVDMDGNPSGGFASGRGIDIRWQAGPLGRGVERIEPNGAFIEGVIQAAIQRLEFFQVASSGRFECGANQDAIEALRLALGCLSSRTQEREQREVEGTHTP